MSRELDDDDLDYDEEPPEDLPKKPLPAGNIRYQIATLFGIGFLWPAGGMWASALAAAFGAVIVKSFGLDGLLIAIVFTYFLGVWAARGHEITVFEHNAPDVIIDEVVGTWVAITALSFVHPTEFTAVNYIIAFVSFRAFAKFEPFPAGFVTRYMPGGWSVMTNSIIAGLYSILLLTAVSALNGQ